MLTSGEKMELMLTHDDSKKAMARRLAIARIACGLEKVDLAREAGISIQTYSHQENGRVYPSRDVLKTLYRDYGIDFNFMFEGAFAHLPAETQSKLFAAAASLSSPKDP